MRDFTLQEVLEALETGWGQYVRRFQRLSPEAQTQFLQRQGFARFHDLLAHIVGWWEEGLRVITGILDEPGFAWQEHDVDAFNAVLVRKFSAWSEVDLLLHFENVREAMIDLVAELPDNALENQDIRGRLYADVLEHLEEHRLPESSVR